MIGRYSDTNGFVALQWGGIVIYNPPSELKNNHVLDSENLKEVMQLFVGQLRELLGIAQTEGDVLPSPKTGIAEWEVDCMKRRYVFANVHSSIASLHSLSKLVQNLTNMVVLDHIATLTSTSVAALSEVSLFNFDNHFLCLISTKLVPHS
jgi:phosphatidylinositol glycan class S